MKQKTLIALLLLISIFTFSQASCDELKKENQILKDKLKQFGIDINDTETKVYSFSSDIKVNYIKCVGDKQQQTVTVYFNILNAVLPNQSVTLMDNIYSNGNTLNSQALDEIGNGYKPLKATFGAANSFFSASNLTTGGSPLSGSITFANILPNITKLSIVSFFLKTQNLLGGDGRKKGIVEIKNVQIDWK